MRRTNLHAAWPGIKRGPYVRKPRGRGTRLSRSGNHFRRNRPHPSRTIWIPPLFTITYTWLFWSRACIY